MDHRVPASGYLGTARSQPGKGSIAVFSVCVWVASVLLLWPAHGGLLNWDEVDYVNAGRLGVWANAVERGSLSPSEFVRFALTKSSGTAPILPAHYNESRDPFLLRHYHPPFVILLLSAVSPSSSERVIRSVQLLGSFAFTCAILFSYQSLAVSGGWTGMFVSGLLALWMIPYLFGVLSFHGWQAVWTTTSAALLSRWLTTVQRIVGFALCASLALAFLTLETGLVVWISTILCLAIWRIPSSGDGKKTFPWRPFAIGAAFIGLFILVAWPGAVLKVSLLKIPAFHAYRIWRGEEYAGVTGILPVLLQSLLPVAILGPLACLWLFLRYRSGLRHWGPFVVIGGLYGLAMIRLALGPQYLLPALAPLVPLVGVAFDRVPSTRDRLLAALGTLLLIVIAWPSGSAGASDRWVREDLGWLVEALRGRQALVDGGHIYQYYLGEQYAIQPITVSYQGDSLTVRERGFYKVLAREDLVGKIVVIQSSRQRFFAGPSEETLLRGCSRVDRRTVMVYDCAMGRV